MAIRSNRVRFIAAGCRLMAVSGQSKSLSGFERNTGGQINKESPARSLVSDDMLD